MRARGREERKRDGGRKGGQSRGVYLYMPTLHIPPYTPIHFKIINIRNMRANIKSKNGHFMGCRAFPKERI